VRQLPVEVGVAVVGHDGAIDSELVVEGMDAHPGSRGGEPASVYRVAGLTRAHYVATDDHGRESLEANLDDAIGCDGTAAQHRPRHVGALGNHGIEQGGVRGPHYRRPPREALEDVHRSVAVETIDGQ